MRFNALQYKFPSPDIIIGRSVNTRIVTVGTEATLVIDNSEYSKGYLIRITNPETDIFIGGPGVTVQSGFAIPSNLIISIGMLENTKLYAVAIVPVTVHVLDMGL